MFESPSLVEAEMDISFHFATVRFRNLCETRLGDQWECCLKTHWRAKMAELFCFVHVPFQIILFVDETPLPGSLSEFGAATHPRRPSALAQRKDL